MRRRVPAMVSRAVVIAVVMWCAVPGAQAQDDDAESSIERVRKRRSQPRRYSSPVTIHVTEWAAAEAEPKEDVETPRVPTVPVPRQLHQELAPSPRMLSEVEPYFMPPPLSALEEIEEPERNWILPQVPGIEAREEEFRDPLESPWEYLQMQLQSQDREYLDSTFSDTETGEPERTERDYLQRLHGLSEGVLNASEHLLYTQESYEEELARDREEETASSRGGTAYEPVVMGTAVEGEREEEGYAALRPSGEPAPGGASREGGEPADRYEEAEEESFEALYSQEVMRRDGVATLDGIAAEVEEEGLSMTSRLLIGVGLDGEMPEDSGVDRIRVSGDPRQGGFPILAHTLGQTASLSTETREAADAGASGTTAPATSWLTADGSIESMFGRQSSSVPSLVDPSRTASRAQPRAPSAMDQIRVSFPSGGSLAGAIHSPATPRVSGLGPTTDFRSGPVTGTPREQSGIDVKNLDILMH